MQQTSSAYFRTLRILHLALFSGQVMFLLICVLLNQTNNHLADPSLIPTFRIIVPGLTVAGIAASFALFRSKLQTAREQPDLLQKMATFRSALILQYALLEGPSLFSIIAFLLSGYWLFIIAAVVLLVLFILQYPSRQKAVDQLNLDYNYQQKIDQQDEYISNYKDFNR